MIVSTPETLGGRPRIDGTRISVATVAFLVGEGETPEYIATEHYAHLTLAQVYAALAYYHSHRDEIDQDTAEEVRAHDEMAAEARRNGQGSISS